MVGLIILGTYRPSIPKFTFGKGHSLLAVLINSRSEDFLQVEVLFGVGYSTIGKAMFLCL